LDLPSISKIFNIIFSNWKILRHIVIITDLRDDAIRTEIKDLDERFPILFPSFEK
jgi:hypothetical protein